MITAGQLLARKATVEEEATLIQTHRIKGLTVKGVLVLERQEVTALERR